MRVEEHLQKARRLDQSMAKLDLHEDYEAIIENCMIAGTHYYNSIMHTLGVTPADKDFKHTYKPRPLRPLVPEHLAPVRDALHRIEALRPHHVRGADPYGPQVGNECWSAYQEVRAFALQTVGQEMAAGS